MTSGWAGRPGRPPDLSAEDQRALGRFQDVVDELKDALDEAVEEAARRRPAFQDILPQIDPETRARQSEESAALARDALKNGNWEPYLARLSEQGVTYAEFGVEFSDWYALLSSYRRIVSHHVLPREPEWPRDVLEGMGQFLDIAMATIAGSYIDRKEALVRRAESHLDLYIKMFHHSPLAMRIYGWSSPPDRATLRLTDANAASGVRDRVGETAETAGLPPLGEKVPDHLAAAVQRREPAHWVHEDPEWGRTYSARCFPLADEYVGLLYEDITDQRRLERDLARHVRDLERSNQELDEFAYIASHDLKSPLRDIDTLADWIVEDAEGALSESSRRHLRLIRDRIGRMERLLEDLLECSRAGRLFAEPEEIELRDEAEQVAELLRPPSSFEIGVQGDAPRVFAPRTPFQQILRNLVSNAIKHHDRERGWVEIEIRDGAEEYVTVLVRDDGPGIPQAFHDRVFRMFHSLRPRDEVEGSGIGLAVVKKLVEGYGGTVALDASEGRGTTVRFTWPKRSRPT